MTIPPIINIVQSSSLTSPVISIKLSGSVNAAASPLLTSQSNPTVVVTLHDSLTGTANFANSATSASVAQVAYAGSGSFTGSFQGALIGSASGNFLGTSNTTGSLLGNVSGTFKGISNATGSWLGVYSGSFSGSVSATGSLLGLASTATSASYALSASYAGGNFVPLSGSSAITGSVTLLRDINVGASQSVATVNFRPDQPKHFYIQASDTAVDFQSNGNTNLRLQPNGGGNVYIGSPLTAEQSLYVTGSVVIGSGPTDGLVITANPSTYKEIQSYGAQPIYLNRQGNDIWLGGNLYFPTDNTFDIGANGANRPRNIYVANQLTSLLVNTGEVFSNTNLILQAATGADIAFDNGSTENMRIFAGGLARITNTLQVGMPRSGSNNITLWSNAHEATDTNDNYGYGTIEVRKQDGTPTGASDARGNEMVFTNRSWLASNSSGFKFIYSGSNIGGYNLLEIINQGTSTFTITNTGDVSTIGHFVTDAINGKSNTPFIVSGTYGSNNTGPFATQFNNSAGPHGNAYSWADYGTTLMTLRGSDIVNGPAAQLTLYGPMNFSSDNSFDLGASGSSGRPRDVNVAGRVRSSGGISTGTIFAYDPANQWFEVQRADLGAKPLRVDVLTGQHSALVAGTSVSGSGAYATHGFQVSGGGLVVESGSVPASSADSTGVVGEIRWANGFIYVKTTTGWGRAALSTF